MLAEKPFYQKFLIGLLALLCLVIIIGGVFWFIFQAVYQSRIFPIVKIEGVDIAGLSTGEAKTKLKSIFEDQEIVFVSPQKQFAIKATGLGANFSFDQATEIAYQFGRSIFNPNIGLEVKLDRQKLIDFLNKNFTEAKTASIDAHFALNEKNQLVVVPAVLGNSFDFSTIDLETKKALLGNDKKVDVVLKKMPVLISDTELENLKPEAENLFNKTPKIQIDGQIFDPTIDQKFGFFKVGVEDGEPKIILNEENIRNYIAELRKKTLISNKPQVVYNTGEQVEEGADGKAIDQNLAYTTLLSALKNRDNKTVVLERKILPKGQSVLEKGFTPGMFPGKYIEVDLSGQVLYQMEGENLIGSHRVSTGKWSMPTPEGTFAINNKDPRAYSNKYKLYMPFWMAFIGNDYGIHELPEWPNGAKEGENHLGTPVSHGCIRLGIGDAETVYNWVEEGTPVVVHK